MLRSIFLKCQDIPINAQNYANIIYKSLFLGPYTHFVHIKRIYCQEHCRSAINGRILTKQQKKTWSGESEPLVKFSDNALYTLQGLPLQSSCGISLKFISIIILLCIPLYI